MRPRLSYANVVATISLFLVLTGGAAYALDGSNTVFTDDLVNGDVKVADIGQGAVATDELANNQVKAADIGDGEVKAAEIANGQVGADEVADGQVRTQEIGNGQVQADDLAPGVAPGASGARAWGLVRSDGELLRSKGVTSVTTPTSENIYCVDPAPGINPETSVMIVSEDIATGQTSAATDNMGHVEFDSNGTFCPDGTMQAVSAMGNGTPGSITEIDLGGFRMEGAIQSFAFMIP